MKEIDLFAGANLGQAIELLKHEAEQAGEREMSDLTHIEPTNQLTYD